MIEDAYDVHRTISLLFLVLVGVAGVGLNLVAFQKAIRACKTEQNLVLINLIISELLISAVGVPFDISGVVTEGASMRGILCPIAAFTHTTSGMSSLFTIVTMAGIRYLSVVRYERRWHIETYKRFWTSRCVQLIWLFSFLMSSPPLFGMGKYVIDVGMISCGPDWASNNSHGLIYNSYLMFFGFLIPTVIIVVSNVKVIGKNRQRRKTKLRWKAAADLTQLSLLQESRNVKKAIQEDKKQMKLTLVLLTMTFSFYLTWTPYAINSFLSMIGTKPPKIAQTLTILFAKSGTVINPILYIFFNKEINMDRKRRCMKRKNALTTTISQSTSKPCPPDNFRQVITKTVIKEVIEIPSSKECQERPKVEILRQSRVPRSQSYRAATRKTIYINFTESDSSSYSYWNQAYSSLEKRNSHYEDRQYIWLDVPKTKKNSIISI